MRESEKNSTEANGRVCLLGDHNDWAGNCSLAAGIEQGIKFNYQPREDKKVVLEAKNIFHGSKTREEFDMGDYSFKGSMRYVEAVAKALEDSGHELKGLDLRLKSNLPMRRGLSSSAALSVGAAKVFNKAFSLGLDRDEIIDTAYRAEHDVLGIECGKMDQTASAYGGVVYIEFSPFSVKSVESKPLHLVIGQVEGERDTKNILNTLNEYYRDRKPELVKAFEKITEITKEGREALLDNDNQRFGKLMDQNQECYGTLKNFCEELDSERLYECLDISRKKGALGAKWTGAGGNGSFVALAKNGKSQESIAEALKEEGAEPIKTVV